LPEDAEPEPERLPQSLRTLEELRATASADHAALSELRERGMPTGPWRTDDNAKAAINAWAKALGQDDRGFAVTWGSARPAIATRGRLHTLVCHDHAASKTKCTWSLSLEECVEGWARAIRSFHPHPGAESGHNHPFIKTSTEAMARSTMREIPPDLVEIGKAMVLSGMGNASTASCESGRRRTAARRRLLSKTCGTNAGRARASAAWTLPTWWRCCGSESRASSLPGSRRRRRRRRRWGRCRRGRTRSRTSLSAPLPAPPSLDLYGHAALQPVEGSR